MVKTKLEIDASIYIVIAFALMLLPFEWVVGWVVATWVHEVSHYIALRAFRVTVFKIRIGLHGARMEIEPIPPKYEILCAAAGPIGGMLLILIGKWAPVSMFCGIVQSTYNLLPVHPMDGGRILSTLLEWKLGVYRGQIIMRWVSICTICCIAAVTAYLWIGLEKGIFALVLPLLFVLKSLRKKS